MKQNPKTVRGQYEAPLCQVVGLVSESAFLTISISSATGAEDYNVVDDSSNWK